MPLYEETIKGDFCSDTPDGMESWLKNCVEYVSCVTGVAISVRRVSSLCKSAGFHVDIAIKPHLSIRFGVMMSTAQPMSNYLSGVVCKDGFFPLNGYGNRFDFSAFYSSPVTVLYSEGLLHVIVTLCGGERKTLFLANVATATETGEEFAGCLGLVMLRDGSASCCGIRRNAYSHDGVHMLIRRAETLNGAFALSNLYTFGESENQLRDFEQFRICFEDGTEKKAVVLGENTLWRPHGKTVCSGRFISFI